MTPETCRLRLVGVGERRPEFVDQSLPVHLKHEVFQLLLWGHLPKAEARDFESLLSIGRRASRGETQKVPSDRYTMTHLKPSAIASIPENSVSKRDFFSCNGKLGQAGSSPPIELGIDDIAKSLRSSNHPRLRNDCPLCGA